MSLATVASVVGIGSGLNSLFGSGSPSGGSSGAYVPTDRSGADQNWQTLLKDWMGSLGQNQAVSPSIAQGFAATQPGNQWGYLPTLMQQFGNAMLDQGTQSQANEAPLLQAGNTLWNTASDPQNALRNQLQQQVTDASRAATSARGIGMGGEAAGIENQDLNNFLINWQNQQLGRQMTGLQGMSSAYGQAANQADQAGRALAGGAGFYNTGAMMPFQFANAANTAYGGLGNNFNSAMGSILQYLGLGNNAANQAFGQQQTGLNNLTTGLGQLGNIFSGTQSPAPIVDDSGGGLPGYSPGGP